jgi:dTDP-4-amino-4,6-dideoxygalactose transaminase
MTTIEGGMVITNSKKLATKIITHRNHGFVTSKKFNSKPWLYDVELPGYNFRLDEIRSALGISQLKRILKLNTLRKKACQYYNLKLKNINGIETPIISKFNDDVNHLYMIRVKKEYGITRDELFRKFMKFGIQTSLHYTPLHEFTLFKKSAKKYVSLKNSTILYDELISLPMFPYISKKEQNTVIKCLLSNSTKNQMNDEK